VHNLAHWVQVNVSSPHKPGFPLDMMIFATRVSFSYTVNQQYFTQTVNAHVFQPPTRMQEGTAVSGSHMTCYTKNIPESDSSGFSWALLYQVT